MTAECTSAAIAVQGTPQFPPVQWLERPPLPGPSPWSGSSARPSHLRRHLLHISVLPRVVGLANNFACQKEGVDIVLPGFLRPLGDGECIFLLHQIFAQPGAFTPSMCDIVSPTSIQGATNPPVNAHVILWA